MREAFQPLHPLLQLLLLIMAGFGALFVCFMLSLIPFMAMGVAVFEVIGTERSLSDLEILMLKCIQIGQAIGLFVVPYLLFRWLVGGQTDYRLTKARGGLFSALVFAAIMLSAFPLVNLLAEWNSHLALPEFMQGIEDWIFSTEQDAERLLRKLLDMDTVGDLAFNLFLIALLPALGEELFFRGMMQPLLLRSIRHYHIAIWVTAFLFSFFHLQFLGFVPRMFLGALLGYAAHWSGSLIVPMVGHFIYNGLNVVILWYIGIETLDSEVETLGANQGELQVTLISLGMVALGMFVLYRRTMAQQKTPQPID